MDGPLAGFGALELVNPGDGHRPAVCRQAIARRRLNTPASRSHLPRQNPHVPSIHAPRRSAAADQWVLRDRTTRTDLAKRDTIRGEVDAFVLEHSDLGKAGSCGTQSSL